MPQKPKQEPTKKKVLSLTFDDPGLQEAIVAKSKRDRRSMSATLQMLIEAGIALDCPGQFPADVVDRIEERRSA